MSLPLNQVILGDCGDVMADWPGNSVDCVVTDPPYRIGFMGSSWDRALPPRRAFRQIFRVLKPGALAFVMSSPRQDVLWRMLAMLDEIGFELKTSAIFWIYKTGFPKAYDVSKGIDRKLLGKVNVEYNPLSEQTPQSDKIQQISHSTHKLGEPKTFFEPASDLAKKWEGWKSQTGLKPAAEVIIQANKPRSEPTIVDNVLKWGTGAVNVDACRIPYQSEEDKTKAIPGGRITTMVGSFAGRTQKGTPKELDRDEWKNKMKGRFPANLLISNGALDTGETTKSTGGINEGKLGVRVYGSFRNESIGQGAGGYGDEGSPYRFFDLDAWSEHHGFLDVAKPSRAERNFGLWNMPIGLPPESGRSKAAEGRKNPLGEPRANYHPTVKPVKLMAYLIELGCPPEGIVVDPFLGSGTTCIAAKRLRRNWIGIEINPEYAEIAEARINIRGPLDQYLENES